MVRITNNIIDEQTIVINQMTIIKKAIVWAIKSIIFPKLYKEPVNKNNGYELENEHEMKEVQLA